MKIERNLFILHIIVFIWGFTGILGNLISISATQLTWYRVLIAFLSLFIYFIITKKSFVVKKSDLIKFFLVGGIVGAHWIFFFQSIKVSTVSVALVCISSVTLFTSFLEPFFYNRKISLLEVITGIVVISAIYLIFKFESQYVLGITYGLICAFLASLFSIINSKFVKKAEGSLISFYEMLGAFLWISLFLAFSNGFNTDLMIDNSDLVYLLILGVICTAGAYVASVNVMKVISPFTVALTTNLEPIYGILLAWMIFGDSEIMSQEFYLGAAIILTAVFIYPFLKIRLLNNALKRKF